MKILGAISVFVCVLLAQPIPAKADCPSLARGLKSACVAEADGSKSVVLQTENSKCNADRIAAIARAWRTFNAAADTPKASYAKDAKSVLDQIVEGSPEQLNCWATIANSCKLRRGPIERSFKALAAGQC